MRKVLILVAIILGVNGAFAACVVGDSVKGNGGNPLGRGCDQNACSGSYRSLNYSVGEVFSSSGRVCIVTSVPCYNSNVYYCSQAGGIAPIRFDCYGGSKGDSLLCVSEGKSWNSQNCTCTNNGCSAQDTANINAQKSRCDSLGGTNDFELVNNGSEGCGLSGFCNLCNGTAYLLMM